MSAHSNSIHSATPKTQRHARTEGTGEDARVPRHLPPPHRLRQRLQSQLYVLERKMRPSELQRRRSVLRLRGRELSLSRSAAIQIEGGVQRIHRRSSVVHCEAEGILQIENLRWEGRTWILRRRQNFVVR